MPPWNNAGGAPNDGCFPVTQWNLVQPAPSQPQRTPADARRELYETYFAPVRRVIIERGFNADEAEELTQDFLVKLLYHDGLAGADRTKGRFRCFIKGAITHYLADRYDHDHTARRGSGAVHFDLDDPACAELAGVIAGTVAPDACASDRAWACAIVKKAHGTIEARYTARGRGDLFLALDLCLAATGERRAVHAKSAKELGRSVATVRSDAARLRGELRAEIEQELRRLVGPERLAEEWRNLIGILCPLRN